MNWPADVLAALRMQAQDASVAPILSVKRLGAGLSNANYLIEQQHSI